VIARNRDCYVRSNPVEPRDVERAALMLTPSATAIGMHGNQVAVWPRRVRPIKRGFDQARTAKRAVRWEFACRRAPAVFFADLNTQASCR
jgi:hypothetical protein